jgi:hypothetical protein
MNGAKRANLGIMNKQVARHRWPELRESDLRLLESLSSQHSLAIEAGDLMFLEHGWYVTHAGLLRLAQRNSCVGIFVNLVAEFSNPNASRWIFQATVFPTRASKGFTGYGDADPSNVSPSMHGAELRIAETRAVNRALRKAYGIGLCSVEELGSSPVPPSNGNAKRAPARLGANLEVVAPVPLRDQLRQLIRQHRLDPVLTKSYALDHLGVKSLRDATREQVNELITHLQKRLFEDRDQFLAELAKCTASKDEKAVA